ncbi:uncharacterized protein BX663DRAFT_485247 [Cokeromyces recurvatus]|uniref:uncharacterized protein n=1 Tax=Cokeromyces recurvatus TaxID=90255 RepID=UPI00221FD94D|nr:uncharacterized protein BX663DRAFT_485247 [Cokeromyces recurvatus]KAI7904432.1 hypothetical protein BX663DRAFT_485247 [Cokeromyces recurvatus]
MTSIKRLNQDVINKMAAGEIIQNPYNAVKELIENSLDAGAKQIQITLSLGGLESIKVKDDGHGIKLEDMPLVCTRYATSKLNQYHDLQKLTTFGFRGEALASLSYISKVKIITNINDQSCAYEASYKDGTMMNEIIKPCAGNKGTIIIVQNLFENMPLRNKMLMSPNKEYQHVMDCVQKYSIHYFHIGFTLFNNNINGILKYPAKNHIESIQHIYGSDISSHLKLIEYEDDNCFFKLYFNDLTDNASMLQEKKGKPISILFVNDKLVENSRIENKIKQVYMTISNKQYTSTSLFFFFYLTLTVYPTHVDINIHPTKNQVYLLNEDKIIDAISKVLHDSLYETFLCNKRKQQQQEKEEDSNKIPEEATIKYYFKPLLPHNNKNQVVVSPDIYNNNESSTSSNSIVDTPLSSSYTVEEPFLQQKESDFMLNNYFHKEEEEKENEAGIIVKRSKINDDVCYLPTIYKNRSISINDPLSSSFLYNDLAITESYSGSPILMKKKNQYREPSNTTKVMTGKTMANTQYQKKLRTLFEGGTLKGDHKVSNNEDGSLIEDLHSIHLLQQEIKNSENKKLSKLFLGYTTLGFIHDFILLVMFKNKYYLINYPLISEEFFYQLIVNQFIQFEKLKLSEPISIQECLLLVTKANTAVMATNHLFAHKDLLDAYFKMQITMDDKETVQLDSLPMLLQDYTPSLDKLPFFLLRISTEVNWENELECLDALIREFAFLYCCYDQVSWNHVKQSFNSSDFKVPKYLAKQGYILELDVPEEIV